MKMRINDKIAEMDLTSNQSYVLVTSTLLWTSKGIQRSKFKVKWAFKGVKLTSSEGLSTIAISSTLNRDIQFIELSNHSVYCPVDKLAVYDASFSCEKEKITLKSKMRFHRLNGVRLSGSGVIGLSYVGKFLVKELKTGESMQIGSDYLLAVYASLSELSGQIVGDTLYKVLFKDDYDGRVSITGPAVVYYQSKKVVQPVEKI